MVALSSYCQHWKLKVNCNKTKIVIFSRGRVPTSNYMFQFGEEDIKLVNINTWEYCLGIMEGLERVS